MSKMALIVMQMMLLVCLISCENEEKKAEIPIVDKELNNINFFLETSASMGGYLRGNSDLVRLIPNLLVDIEGRIKSTSNTIRINYIYDSIRPYTGTTNDFIHDISTTTVATGNSSQMHKVFELVTKATDSNDISILVSDCILSYPDSNIKANEEINVEKADGELKAFVKQAFLRMKNRNVCATVYGFSSKFIGTYYTYRNGKIPLNGSIIRPYYIWVIGDKELVQRFNKQLGDINSFKPELEVNFGLFEKPISKYTLLFKTGRSGEWAADINDLKDAEISKKSPVKFSIAVDFSSLPDYAKELAYLDSNLTLKKSDLEAEIIDIKSAKDIDLKNAAPKEKGPLQEATHVINIVVSDLYQPKGNITLKLPLKYDTAYRNWSVMDDRDIKAVGKRTFAFEHLVDGIMEAYQNNNENYINIIINIKK